MVRNGKVVKRVEWARLHRRSIYTSSLLHTYYNFIRTCHVRTYSVSEITSGIQWAFEWPGYLVSFGTLKLIIGMHYADALQNRFEPYRKTKPCAPTPDREEVATLFRKKTTPLPFKQNHFSNKSVRELIQKSFTSSLDQHLGEQISQVGCCPLFGYPGHSGSYSFPALMVENTYVLLFQCRIRVIDGN